MKLTDQSHWRYDISHATKKNLKNIRRRDEWLQVVEKFIPNDPLDYLELGCAPGQYSAVLSEGKEWRVSGIDYSEDADLFIETLGLVNKKAELFKMDMFSERIDRSFDIVISIGLVEHFRGEMLDDVFKLHDSYVKPGGFVVIQMPNFTGFQYFWHYLFDRPDLDNHNIDVMQPQSLQWFADHGYEVLFNDYVGVLRLWGNSSWTHIRFLGKAVAALGILFSKIAIVFDRLGIKLRGRTWSPGLLIIAKKTL